MTQQERINKNWRDIECNLDITTWLVRVSVFFTVVTLIRSVL